MTVAALYVERGGPYFDVLGIDPWDERRDARQYAGPYPVIAHPPCARWGRYWSGGPMLAGTARAKKLGDDGGCFSAALWAVRTFGGVLEHPEASHAWPWFGLFKPPRKGGWVDACDGRGYTCCVEQGHYGHKARKATWLYVVGCRFGLLPELQWGPSKASIRLDDGFHSKEECRKSQKLGTVSRLKRWERKATPTPFRDILINIAQRCDRRPWIERML